MIKKNDLEMGQSHGGIFEILVSNMSFKTGHLMSTPWHATEFSIMEKGSAMHSHIQILPFKISSLIFFSNSPKIDYFS